MVSPSRPCFPKVSRSLSPPCLLRTRADYGRYFVGYFIVPTLAALRQADQLDAFSPFLARHPTSTLMVHPASIVLGRSALPQTCAFQLRIAACFAHTGIASQLEDDRRHRGRRHRSISRSTLHLQARPLHLRPHPFAERSESDLGGDLDSYVTLPSPNSREELTGFPFRRRAGGNRALLDRAPPCSSRATSALCDSAGSRGRCQPREEVETGWGESFILALLDSTLTNQRLVTD